MLENVILRGLVDFVSLVCLPEAVPRSMASECLGRTAFSKLLTPL